VSAANSLVGSSTGDRVGTGVTVLGNGNYVVASPNWNAGRGAATWGDGTAGVTGPVDAGNSLAGTNPDIDMTHPGDHVGAGVAALGNGNYVVQSPNWNGQRGAATWGSGTAGVRGTVGATNSLVGSDPNDQVGGAFFNGVVALGNGNYVVGSPGWSGRRGAVTWGDGTAGVTGPVDAGNSLVGPSPNDQVGFFITALSNGNYVVVGPGWNGVRGAATWGSGLAGVRGPVSAANSLVGASPNDQVGNAGVTALSNGNYVVQSPFWDGRRGAATWGDGTTGASGPVSTANSLVGSIPNDQVGSFITPLTNGNYVVPSPSWNDNRGAATWGSGTAGVDGPVDAGNSLVGSNPDDRVGRSLIGTGGVTPPEQRQLRGRQSRLEWRPGGGDLGRRYGRGHRPRRRRQQPRRRQPQRSSGLLQQPPEQRQLPDPQFGVERPSGGGDVGGRYGRGQRPCLRRQQPRRQ
jgi:hypothetical protein